MSARIFAFTGFSAPTRKAGTLLPLTHEDVNWPRLGGPVEGDLEATADFLTTPVEAEDKYLCPFFVPARLAGGLRRKDAVEAVTLLGFDFDKGGTGNEAHRAVDGWAHVMHTTWSHREDEAHFRLVLFPDRDMSASEYARVWKWGAHVLGNRVDDKTKDASRAFFLPAIKPDGTRAWSKAWLDRPLFPVDHALEQARRLWPSRRPRQNHHFGDAELNHALRDDPDARLRLAVQLGARVGGNRATHIHCPSCGRASVWFWIDPREMHVARCNHLNSCGWFGHLDQLGAHGGAR
ncbi:MAG: hypothetical protein H6716_28190 [Polyangiaceae bacterium]|nr:hypothetical protein [Polyangiaceae bacterium]